MADLSWTYEAVDAQGKRSAGVVQAPSREAALASVEAGGLSVRRLRPGAGPLRTRYVVRNLLGLGLLLVAAAVGTLSWVEAGRARALHGLEALRRAAVEAPVARGVEAAEGAAPVVLDGHAVHAVGAVTSERLVDALGVSVDGLRLEREVLMRQWRQEKRRRRGSDGKSHTVTVCAEAWSAEPETCCARHANPPLPLGSVGVTARDARVGLFRLGVDAILAAPLTPLHPPPPPPELAGRRVRAVGDEWRVGVDPNAPRLGDLRISFRAALAPPVASVVARLEAGTFIPWTPPGGDPLVLFAPGVVSTDDLVDAAIDRVPAGWLWRAGALLAAAVGVTFTLSGLDLGLSKARFKAAVAAFALSAVLAAAALAWLITVPSLAARPGAGVLACALIGLAVVRRPS